MTDIGAQSEQTAQGPEQSDDPNALELKRGAARLDQWMRNAGRSRPKDAQALLQDPGRKLTLLKAFGATRYLSQLALAYPDAVIEGMSDGPSAVLAQAARDLMTLDRGAGGAEALYEALKPLKQRCDLVVGLAEISGEWTGAEAASARTDVAERIVEAAIQWLARGAYRRGEAQSKDKDSAARGLFAVAGGDFATEELGYFGPMNLVVVYDVDALREAGVTAPERTFMRMGTELRQALEAPPGGKPLYAPKAPAVTGLAGSPLMCSANDVFTAIDAAEAGGVKAWFATARVVAGDRAAGGAFMEKLSERLWDGDAAPDDISAMIDACDGGVTADNPSAPFDKIAHICRLTLGRKRPVFRTASARLAFETAAGIDALGGAAAERLAVGGDLARAARALVQLVKGAAGDAPDGVEEKHALAALCGYRDTDGLASALKGAAAEAENMLHVLTVAPEEVYARFTDEASDAPYDVGKLETLGFQDGEKLSCLVDEWVRRAASPGDEGAGRLSALAPGLLTAFGETQAPEKAIAAFDALVRATPDDQDVFAKFRAYPGMRQAVVDFAGCCPDHATALIAVEPGALTEARGEETPQNPEEWLSRFAPTWAGADGAAASESDVCAWRQREIARAAFYATAGDISFDLVPSVTGTTLMTALAALFETALTVCASSEQTAAAEIAVLALDNAGEGRVSPGAPLKLCFVARKEVGAAGEAFVRRYVDLIESAGGVTVDLSRRPGGVSGALVPTVDTFKQYYHAEAVATEQLSLHLAKAVAGPEGVRTAVDKALREVLTAPRKAEIVLRDADRGRARLARHVRARSLWDFRRIEGGLDDVDLIIGGLVLKYGASHPYILTADADECLDAMARANLVDETHTEELKSTRAFWMRMLSVQGLTGWLDPETAPPSARLSALIAKAAGVGDFSQVEPLIRGHADRANVLYNHLILGRDGRQAASPHGVRMGVAH